MQKKIIFMNLRFSRNIFQAFQQNSLNTSTLFCIHQDILHCAMLSEGKEIRQLIFSACQNDNAACDVSTWIFSIKNFKNTSWWHKRFTWSYYNSSKTVWQEMGEMKEKYPIGNTRKSYQELLRKGWTFLII